MDYEDLSALYPLEPGVKIWVTKKNHEWAALASGLPIEEIKKRYDEARARKIICTITVPHGG